MKMSGNSNISVLVRNEFKVASERDDAVRPHKPRTFQVFAPKKYIYVFLSGHTIFLFLLMCSSRLRIYSSPSALTI